MARVEGGERRVVGGREEGEDARRGERWGKRRRRVCEERFREGSEREIGLREMVGEKDKGEERRGIGKEKGKGKPRDI